nr:coiled-coil domain-containing protein 102B [Loxodonta africana]
MAKCGQLRNMQVGEMEMLSDELKAVNVWGGREVILDQSLWHCVIIDLTFLFFLQISLFHGQHENEVEGKSKDVKEGPKSQNSKDREIHELRRELERLQAENTSEWDQREMLETEKQGLERENRRLKVQVRELEELLDRRNKLSANSQDPGFKTPEIELQEQSEVWVPLVSACSFSCIFSS